VAALSEMGRLPSRFLDVGIGTHDGLLLCGNLAIPVERECIFTTHAVADGLLSGST